MGDLLQREIPVDMITLSEELSQRKHLQAVGGKPYLFSLTENLPRRLAIDSYVHIVQEKFMLRQVLRIAQDGTARALDQDEDCVDILARMGLDIENCMAETNAGDNPLVSAYSTEALDRFVAERCNPGMPGVTYGHGRLDSFTGGMRRGEVTVVGARSGIGKSALLCQMTAANCSVGIPVHLFSMEMTRQQVLHRLWSIVSGVPFTCIDRPATSTLTDVDALMRAAAVVSEWPLRIHDQGDMDLGQIVALARISIRKYKTRVVAVDYAQIIDAEGKDERTKVSTVSRKLTRLVKHEDASLMLLSQLRKVDRDSIWRAPHIGDLRETGQLENDAHVVVLLHRTWDEERGRISRDGEFIVPKQRNGDTGTIRAQFNSRLVTFE